MFNSTAGQAREEIDADEMERLRSTVVIDQRRRRPLYFDGRFLAARDLVREQEYFLARQADLGRAGGAGVVHGLQVRREPPHALRISAGHGVTPAGELVALPQELRVDLADLPQIQRLDAAFGLIEAPREPSRNRSGLFIVGLRPVEFAANPIASYPTSINGQRGVEFGEIVEGVAVTLVPYSDDGTGSTAELRRARAAYDIFVNRSTHGAAAPILPLAMVLLNRGLVQWVDPFLVRREIGADHGDVLGLGYAPRVLREAHLLQYDRHLQEVIGARRAAGLGERFAAAEYFQALPPAGRLPAAAVNPADFTQNFFPPTVEVDLTLVPEDEITSLLEESLLLPPIDLTRSAEELDATSVLVMIPVPRARFRTEVAKLGSVQRTLGSAAPWAVARRKPLEVLRGIRLPAQLARSLAAEGADTAWRNLIPTTGTFWYLRRRNVQYRGDVTGVPVQVEGQFETGEGQFDMGEGEFDGSKHVLLGGGGEARLARTAALDPAGPPPAPAPETRTLEARDAAPAPTEAVAAPAPAPVKAEPAPAPAPAPVAEARPAAPATDAATLLSEARLDPAVLESPRTLADGVIAATAKEQAAGGEVAVRVEELAATPKFGTGLKRLEQANPALKDPRVAENLARSGAAAQLDQLARDTPRAELAALSEEVQKAATARGKAAPDRLNRLVQSRRPKGGEK